MFLLKLFHLSSICKERWERTCLYGLREESVQPSDLRRSVNDQTLLVSCCRSLEFNKKINSIKQERILPFLPEEVLDNKWERLLDCSRHHLRRQDKKKKNFESFISTVFLDLISFYFIPVNLPEVQDPSSPLTVITRETFRLQTEWEIISMSCHKTNKKSLSL